MVINPINRFTTISKMKLHETIPVQPQRNKRTEGRKVQFPTVVVKNHLGRTLDTFTGLQEDIYRARWKVKETKEATTSLEWRLPHAPVPSRPDYSRTGPHWLPLIRKSQFQQLSTGGQSNVRQKALDVEDVSFVAKSLKHLPNLPLLSFLHYDLFCEQKTYFQMASEILLHQKLLSATENRRTIHVFPGFCAGCRRVVLCQGCEKPNRPHYHRNKLARTGGGFTYFKQLESTQTGKHGHKTGLKVHYPEQAFKSLMRDYQYLLHRGANENSKAVYSYSDLAQKEQATVDMSSDSGVVHQAHPSWDNSSVESDSDSEEGILADLGDTKDEHVFGDNLGVIGGKGITPRSSRADIWNVSSCSSLSENESWEKDGLDSGMAATRDGGDSNWTEKIESSVGLQEKCRTLSIAKDKIGLGSVVLAGNVSNVSSKLKKKTKPLVARSPFSTNRVYSYIREGPIKQIKSKKTTMFVEFQRSGNGWKKPKKFVVRKPNKDPLQFWKPSKKQPLRQVTKSKKLPADKENIEKDREWKHTLTPDSGLASEQMTEYSEDHHDLAVRMVQSANCPHSSENPDDYDTVVTLVQSSNCQQTPEIADDYDTIVSLVQSATCLPTPENQDDYDSIVSLVQSANCPQTSEQENMSRQEILSRQEIIYEWDEVSCPNVKSRHDTVSQQEIISQQDLAFRTDSKSVNSLHSSSCPHQQDFTEYLREHKLGTPEGGRRRSPVKKVKKEVARERRQPIPPIGPEQRQLTPKTEERRSFVRDRSQDIITEPPVARRSYQDLPPLELPPLPKYSEEKIKSEKRRVIQRELIESMPDMKEPAKKLRPPPKVYNIPKQGSMPRRRGQPAEAPVSSKEIQQMQDPLNFLAKYCIIHPDRLPYYEWVFQAVISEQIPKYKRTSHVTTYHNGVREASSDCQLSPHEMSMLHDITVINHGQIPEKVGLSVPEQYLEKTCYTFDMLQEKYRKMEHQLHKMEVKKINLMAHLAREMFPDITKVDYQVKAAKKGKKGKKNKSEEPEPIQRLLRKEDINDEVIVGRLDDKMISVLNKRKDIAHFEVAIDRTMEKLAGLENRLEHIERKNEQPESINIIKEEKKMLDVYCMECYFQGKTDGNRPMEFRRQQSSLYNKLHPKIDFEIELDKVESALQQINNNLLTDKELVYLYHILNLPGRRRLSFRLFSIVAALSEKVTQLDPILRKLLNKLDYNALDVRMSKCKELFSLLQDGEIVPSGNALASCLRVELAAGGMTPEHTSHVLSKFNRDGKGLVDFLDFVMYMPLFIKIHNRIVKDPLREDLDL